MLTIKRQEVKVIEGFSPLDFERKVNEYLSAGWTIQSSYINSYVLDDCMHTKYFAILVNNFLK